MIIKNNDDINNNVNNEDNENNINDNNQNYGIALHPLIGALNAHIHIHTHIVLIIFIKSLAK